MMPLHVRDVTLLLRYSTAIDRQYVSTSSKRVEKKRHREKISNNPMKPQGKSI